MLRFFYVQGEWHTPQHSFTAASTRVEAAEMNDTNPLGSGSHKGPRPRPASRDAGIDRLGAPSSPRIGSTPPQGAEARSAWSSS